jgi:Zn-dependent M28 family amino/carboxypeptidase
LISRLSSKYPFAKEVSGKGGGGSDHVSFSRRGVPALFIHTGLHQNYHTVNDTPEKLNYKGMERIARYGFDLLWLVDQSEDTPKMEWNVKSEPQDRFDHNVPDSPFPQ